MGPKRATRRAMVDRRRGREVQDGKRKNRQSKCDVRGEGQGLGRRVQWATRRHLGLFYWPAKNSRRPGIGKETRRNVPLESRLRRNSDVRRRISPLGLLNTEKIEIASDCTACACDNLKRFKTGVTYLQTGAILAVLNHSIVQLEFPLRCQDIISASGKKVKLAYCPYIPVVIWLVNQRRLREDALKPKLIADQPDNTATRRDNRILEGSPAHTAH